MDFLGKISHVLDNEAVAVIAGLLALATTVVTWGSLSAFDYLAAIDTHTLIMLFCLMFVVAGLREEGVLHWTACNLIVRARDAQVLSFILIGCCFFGSRRSGCGRFTAGSARSKGKGHCCRADYCKHLLSHFFLLWMHRCIISFCGRSFCRITAMGIKKELPEAVPVFNRKKTDLFCVSRAADPPAQAGLLTYASSPASAFSDQ